MIVSFPYAYLGPMHIPDASFAGVYGLPHMEAASDVEALMADRISTPIGTPPLRELARGKRRLLVVVDDISRPTPVHRLLPPVLGVLRDAGLDDDSVEFMVALGTHRPMTRDEMAQKLGADVLARHQVHNHDWRDRDACVRVGTTDDGTEVWVNRKVMEADLVVGIGRIMPIDICGFTGGGKILIPGVCGRITNDQMHWHRVMADDSDIIGHRENAVRKCIDALARQAGLGFILNVIMHGCGHIIDAVAGDLTEAHRVGCEKSLLAHSTFIPQRPDVVVADGYPFDIEFWQVNKALDTAGLVVRNGGVVIMVSPCYEGFSQTHPEVLQFGYRPISEIIELVESGRIQHKVVGVHMCQVRRVIDRATVILVTDGISTEHVESVGLRHAATPDEALATALELAGGDARVAVLRNAAEMLPIVGVGAEQPRSPEMGID